MSEKKKKRPLSIEELTAKYEELEKEGKFKEITKEEFDEALRRVSKKKAPKDPEK